VKWKFLGFVFLVLGQKRAKTNIGEISSISGLTSTISGVNPSVSEGHVRLQNADGPKDTSLFKLQTGRSSHAARLGFMPHGEIFNYGPRRNSDRPLRLPGWRKRLLKPIPTAKPRLNTVKV
jgi:hypothetical protein